MSDSRGKKLPAKHDSLDVRTFLRREPVILALLSAVAVVCFMAVSGLSRTYHSQRLAIAVGWFTRGVQDLHAQRFNRAEEAFRTALLYSPNNYSYQLNLAQALIGEKRTGEAFVYLRNLWEREPEDGLVNLELARISAQIEGPEQATRYYHNATYAVWPGDQKDRREQTRLELIDYLLKINNRVQAQSELIALSAEVGDDATQQAHIGDLFVRAGDFTDALAAYRVSLKSARKNPQALAGAGRAAFELGRYILARRYLDAAVAMSPGDTNSAALLQTTRLVLRLDPFRSHISAAQRGRIIVEAFKAAGDRLQSCTAAIAPGQPLPWQQGLAQAWKNLQPRVTEWELRRNPDLGEQAMELVFNIEHQTNAACGKPAGIDQALLLIARIHEGS